MKVPVTLPLILASLMTASLARAHFVWATVEPAGKTLRMEVAESPGESIAPMLGKFISATKRNGIGEITDERDHLSVTAPLNKPGSAGGIDLLYGVHGTDLIHWSAKGAANLNAAGRALGLPSEIVVRKTKGGLIAIVTKGGKASPGADVEIYMPGSKTPIQKKSGADGSVALPAVTTGVLAIGARVIENTAGDYKGTHYTAIWDMPTITVRVG
jgi:hypothetical protein